MALSSAITIAGSQTIADVCFHMIEDDVIAEHLAICDLRSSTIIWKPAFIVVLTLVGTKAIAIVSYRIGGACHAAEQGYFDAQIRAFGRWKSDAFKVYLKSGALYAN